MSRIRQVEWIRDILCNLEVFTLENDMLSLKVKISDVIDEFDALRDRTENETPKQGKSDTWKLGRKIIPFPIDRLPPPSS